MAVPHRHIHALPCSLEKDETLKMSPMAFKGL